MAMGCLHTPYGSDKTCRACSSPEAMARGERIKSVALQFTYGKETFHGPTIKETQDEWLSHARAQGVEPERADDTYRWV
jgi:hypothetical protein